MSSAVMGAAVIAARGVAKSYREGPQPVEVLKGADLEISGGEVVAIVGASGSGKSTCCTVSAGSTRSTPARC